MKNDTGVQLMLWDPMNLEFKASFAIKAFHVASVVPSDFNCDGQLDVLLVFEDCSSRIYFGRLGSEGVDDNFLSIDSSRVQPTLFDYNGDMRIDLLGYPKNSDTLSVWKNVQVGDSISFEM